MTNPSAVPRVSRSALGAVVRAAGRGWRRVARGDGGDGAPPLRLPDRPAILVLQLQQVGDSLMMSPVIRSVRQRYPGATIDLLTTPTGFEVFRRCPYIDRVHLVPSRLPTDSFARRASAWRAVLRDVRRAHYDCVLACRNHVSINYVLTAVAAGARHTVGFDEAPGGFLFTRRLHVTAGVSVLRTNLALAAAIDADPETGREEFWFGEEDSAAVAALLGRRGIPADAPIAVIHPASNWQSKTWYPDRWAAVADWLATEGGLRPVFVGRSRDADVIRAVQESMRADSYSVAGETDLCQLGALMARADLFVGTDSGPRHIAGALGRPQVTVMSSLDEPWRWGLDRPGEILLRTDPPCHGCMLSSCSHRLCLDLISADRVIAACRELLGRTRPAAVPRLTMSV